MISHRSKSKASYSIAGFRLKISFSARAATKSRCEWIDATAATAWLQPAADTSSRSLYVCTYIHTYIHIYIYMYTHERTLSHSHSSIAIPFSAISSPSTIHPPLHLRFTNHPLSTGPMASPIHTIIPASIHISVTLGHFNTTVGHHGLYLWDCNPHFGVMLLSVRKIYCKKHSV